MRQMENKTSGTHRFHENELSSTTIVYLENITALPPQN